MVMHIKLNDNILGVAVTGADVILQGANTYLTYTSLEQSASHTTFESSLEIVETRFELPSGQQANREHVMEVLRDLRGIYIRAQYWSTSDSAR